MRERRTIKLQRSGSNLTPHGMERLARGFRYSTYMRARKIARHSTERGGCACHSKSSGWRKAGRGLAGCFSSDSSARVRGLVAPVCLCRACDAATRAASLCVFAVELHRAARLCELACKQVQGQLRRDRGWREAQISTPRLGPESTAYTALPDFDVSHSICQTRNVYAAVTQR